MKTPLKLKRSELVTLSTIDRTELLPKPSLTLASVAPAFRHVLPPPPDKPALLPLRTCIPANTTELEKQLG
jgi:hypothetical protein